MAEFGDSLLIRGPMQRECAGRGWSISKLSPSFRIFQKGAGSIFPRHLIRHLIPLFVGETRQTLDMYIPEATGQPSVAQLAITAACLEGYPALGKPIAIDIFKRSELPADCR